MGVLRCELEREESGRREKQIFFFVYNVLCSASSFSGPSISSFMSLKEPKASQSQEDKDQIFFDSNFIASGTNSLQKNNREILTWTNIQVIIN